MQTYRVIWEIDIDAESPEQAALLALNIQRDAASQALVFDTVDENGETKRVDLLDEVSQ